MSDILEELVALSHFMGAPHRDLAILGEGNTSAKIDDATFYIKASGQTLETIPAEGFCKVRFDKILPLFDKPDLTDLEVKDALLHSKEGVASSVMPSVETFFHAYLLSLPGIGFIAHTHPIAVNSILCSQYAKEAVSGRLFPDEVVCCGVAPCFVEYVDPGMPLSRTIKQRVEEYIEEYNELPKVILMQSHGLIAVGKTPKDCRTITEMYVKTARVILGTYALGGPNFMTPENVSRIHSRPDEHYRQKQIGSR